MMKRVDLVALGSCLIAFWGFALVTRGAYASLCPGCVGFGDSGAFVVVGLVLSMGAAAFLWSRSLRVAAALVVVPGLVAGLAMAIIPAGAFTLLSLLGMPTAVAASAAALGGAQGRRDRHLVTWAFAISAIVGATGTGLLALAASMTVVVCSLLGPESDRFVLPWRSMRVPDDISGM